MSKNLLVRYYQENKERLQKRDRKRYQNLSKEEQEKKQRCGCERYKNLSKYEKQNLVQYRKKILYNTKKDLIIKSNDLKSYFEAINLLKKAYLNKILEYIYIHIYIYKFLSKS